MHLSVTEETLKLCEVINDLDYKGIPSVFLGQEKKNLYCVKVLVFNLVSRFISVD